jgi:hypothetical protein
MLRLRASAREFAPLAAAKSEASTAARLTSALLPRRVIASAKAAIALSRSLPCSDRIRASSDVRRIVLSPVTALSALQTERLQMRVSKGFLKSVDDWRRKQEDLPSRSEAIRRLVEQALSKPGKSRP